MNKQNSPNAYVRLVYHRRIMPVRYSFSNERVMLIKRNRLLFQDGVVTPFLPHCKRCGKVIIVRKARTQHGVTTTVRSAESYKDTRFDELD